LWCADDRKGQNATEKLAKLGVKMPDGGPAVSRKQRAPAPPGAKRYNICGDTRTEASVEDVFILC
jgi:hypothetical protein